MIEVENPKEREYIEKNCAVGSLLIPETKEDQKKEVLLNDYVVNNKLMLINGRHLELVLNSRQQQITENKMPVTLGYVGKHKVTALRDMG